MKSHLDAQCENLSNLSIILKKRDIWMDDKKEKLTGVVAY